MPQATRQLIHVSNSARIIQVGIIVHDAEAAVAAWTSRFKLAPARFVDRPIPGKNLEETAMYRGERGNFRMRLAFLEAGPVQIEFIQPLEGDNIYSEFLNEHGEGLHHILFEAEDPPLSSRVSARPCCKVAAPRFAPVPLGHTSTRRRCSRR